jgi:hypothetical protein
MFTRKLICPPQIPRNVDFLGGLAIEALPGPKVVLWVWREQTGAAGATLSQR